MADENAGLPSVIRLLDDLSKEYYAILDVVSEYDGRALTVKGWSVTLSLASLGIGLQQGHAGLFLLAALTGLAFWYIDVLMKGFQFRYYVRMRDIEYAAYLANPVTLQDADGVDVVTSAPRVDMIWGFTGWPTNTGRDGEEVPRRIHPPFWLPLAPQPVKDRYARKMRDWPPKDWRDDPPERRTGPQVYRKLKSRWVWPNVALPHAAAVLVGAVFFALWAARAPGFDGIHF